MLASEHPIGKKILDIIRGWNNFIDFDDMVYYHARGLEDGQKPYLDSEMMQAPTNVSKHGRYNEIGRSCYYITETKECAVKEINKHSGGRKRPIQIIGLKPIRKAGMIDLSGKAKPTNKFVEYIRFTVENKAGEIIKEYLMPNYVAACCKHCKIDGIKYKSGSYYSYVLWKDSCFEIVDGSREIIEQTAS